MKVFVLLSLMTFGLNAFATDYYETVRCVSDEVSVVVLLDETVICKDKTDGSALVFISDEYKSPASASTATKKGDTVVSMDGSVKLNVKTGVALFDDEETVQMTCSALNIALDC